MIRALKKLINLAQDIWHDRRLLKSLTIKDFLRRFAGSYFGIVWGFVTPLVTILIYWMVFQFGFRSGNVDDIPFVLWFICGMIVWLFYSEALSLSSNSFLEYSYLVKKVVFNINILPLVKIFSSLLVHFFFIVLASIACIILGFFPNLYWLQLPYYMVCSILLVFSTSLVFASVNVFFRDLGQVIGIILLIGMWGTPIAWNPDMFPESIQIYFKLNPIYYIVEGYRNCFIQHTWFWEDYKFTAYFWCLILIKLLIGAFVYDRLKNSFADFL